MDTTVATISLSEAQLQTIADDAVRKISREIEELEAKKRKVRNLVFSGLALVGFGAIFALFQVTVTLAVEKAIDNRIGRYERLSALNSIVESVAQDGSGARATALKSQLMKVRTDEETRMADSFPLLLGRSLDYLWNTNQLTTLVDVSQEFKEEIKRNPSAVHTVVTALGWYVPTIDQTDDTFDDYFDLQAEYNEIASSTQPSKAGLAGFYQLLLTYPRRMTPAAIEDEIAVLAMMTDDDKAQFRSEWAFMAKDKTFDNSLNVRMHNLARQTQARLVKEHGAALKAAGLLPEAPPAGPDA